MDAPFEPEPRRDESPAEEFDRIESADRPDVDEEQAVPDPDAEAAAAAAASRGSVFRRPSAGDRIDREDLERDLDS